MDQSPARRQGRTIEVHPLHDQDAARREREYWMSSAPAECMEALDRLREEREWLESLNASGAQYVVVGGIAPAHHGLVRYTGDIDVLVKASEANAERLGG